MAKRKTSKIDVNIKGIEKYLDKLWSTLVKHRDDGCQWCGREDGKMDAHHIFPRKRKNTRWDSQNGIKLCYHCHKWRLVDDYEGLREICVKRFGSEELYRNLYYRSLTDSASHSTCENIDYEKWELLLRFELSNLGVKLPRKSKHINRMD